VTGLNSESEVVPSDKYNEDLDDKAGVYFVKGTTHQTPLYNSATIA